MCTEIKNYYRNMDNNNNYIPRLLFDFNNCLNRFSSVCVIGISASNMIFYTIINEQKEMRRQKSNREVFTLSTTQGS